MIRRRPVGMMPKHISESRRGGADVGMRVVAVDAPRLQRALHDEVIPRSADVIHHFFPAAFLNCYSDAPADSFKHLIPRCSCPLPSTARPNSFHRIKDSIRIVDLIDDGWPFGANSAPAGRMFRVAFELRDLPGFLVDIRQQPASRFAIETDGRNDLVMTGNTAWPSLGVVLHPIVPFVYGGTGLQMATVALEFSHIRLRAFP